MPDTDLIDHHLRQVVLLVLAAFVEKGGTEVRKSRINNTGFADVYDPNNNRVATFYPIMRPYRLADLLDMVGMFDFPHREVMDVSIADIVQRIQEIEAEYQEENHDRTQNDVLRAGA